MLARRDREFSNRKGRRRQHLNLKYRTAQKEGVKGGPAALRIILLLWPEVERSEKAPGLEIGGCEVRLGGCCAGGVSAGAAGIVSYTHAERRP